METAIMGVLLVLLGALEGPAAESQGRSFRITIDERGEFDLAEVIERLGKAIGTPVRRPEKSLRVPARGLGGVLTKSTLKQTLGPRADFRVDERGVEFELKGFDKTDPGATLDLRERLETLARRVEREGGRRLQYGMHALTSYRPNDPARPTICLVHGMNSTSGVFIHMFRPLQEAGYGLVVYDFPYNRSLKPSAEEFVRDWVEFRRKRQEKQPWIIIAHSMGALLARTYVEDDRIFANDVSSMILIAPVNSGSRLAKAQTLLQLRKGLQAIGGDSRADALAHLGEGLGEAAADLSPGSAFLREVNKRRPPKGVPYHVLAGDQGFLTRASRAGIEAALGNRGVLSTISRLAGAAELPFDEVTEGSGDGCVSVEQTKIVGVEDHVVIHANHLELIRAPLLYPDPGPVASMPLILDRLRKDAVGRTKSLQTTPKK